MDGRRRQKDGDYEKLVKLTRNLYDLRCCVGKTWCCTSAFHRHMPFIASFMDTLDDSMGVVSLAFYRLPDLCGERRAESIGRRVR